MSYEISWDSVPKKRQAKTEKLLFPALTLCSFNPDSKGTGRKISINKAGQSLLGLQGENHVNFGYDTKSSRVFIRKAVDNSGKKLTKSFTLSDKKIFDTIVNIFGLSTTSENDFEIVEQGSNLFELILVVDLLGLDTKPAVEEGVIAKYNSSQEDCVIAEAPLNKTNAIALIPESNDEVMDPSFEHKNVEVGAETKSEEDDWN